MVRRRALVALVAAFGTAGAIRVDDEIEEGDEAADVKVAVEANEDQDLTLKISLADRAAAGAGDENKALLHRLMDGTLHRKVSAAEKENRIKTIRAREAGNRASAAAKALEREALLLKKAETLEKHKVEAAKSTKNIVKSAMKKEEAEVAASNKAVRRARSPEGKRKAKEEAAFAEAKLRKAEAEFKMAKVTFQRAEEEAMKKEEEAAGAAALQKIKQEESGKQYQAESFGKDRQKAEATVTEKKKEYQAARRAYDLDEAAELRALSAHNKPDADAAAVAAKKERLELDAATASRKRAEDAALELEGKMVTSSEEAQKLGEGAVLAAANNKMTKAEREHAKQISIAREEGARKTEEIRRAEEAMAVNRTVEADAAGAEARRAATAETAAETAAGHLDNEVKFRKSAAVAAKARLDAEKKIMLFSNEKLAAEQKASREGAGLRMAVLEHSLEGARRQHAKLKTADAEIKAATKAKNDAEKEAAEQDQKEQEDIKKAEDAEAAAYVVEKADHRAPCADEHGLCMCKGTVVYGRKYLQGESGPVRNFDQTLANRIRQKPSSWGLLCSDIVFGEPAEVNVSKHCFCKDQMSVILAERKAFHALQEAEAALAKISMVRKAFHREQGAVEDAVELGEKDAERAMERAYSQAFMSEKRIQKAENEALRVSVENGGGEDAMDDIGIHEIIKARQAQKSEVKPANPNAPSSATEPETLPTGYAIQPQPNAPSAVSRSAEAAAGKPDTPGS